MSPPFDSIPHVASTIDFASHDGQKVAANGIYRAIVMPKKGPAVTDERKTHALLEFADGQHVYLEAYGMQQATRREDELRRFDGRRVTIVGVAHRIMPSPRAGLVAPCLSEVESVVEADSGDSDHDNG